MKYISLLFVLLLAGCNQQDSKKTTETTSSDSAKPPATKQGEDTVSQQAAPSAEQVVLELSDNILADLKTRNFESLATHADPLLGIRFVPYAYIDTATSKVLTRDQLILYGDKSTKFTWGTTDGEGKPIVLSIGDYFKRYVYDKDYLAAKDISVNKFLAKGNSLNNLKEVYPGMYFTEFYFRGTDSRHDGMDWKALRLVFKKSNNQYYLIAVVHDEWTI